VGLLRVLRPELTERFGVRRLALFGSIVRDEQRPGRDVDLLTELKPGCSLFDLVELADYLEQSLGRRVDVGTFASLHPGVRERVLSEMVAV